LLSLLFLLVLPNAFIGPFSDIIAAAPAQLSPDLLKRQAAAMDGWHRHGRESTAQYPHALAELINCFLAV
jgi:hypothetical protein